ncbi:MAG: AmmeMemoRadiSam system protein B [Patescibacteria group bacterium]
MVRKPNVAGSFYPADKGELSAELERCFRDAAVTPSEVQGKGIKAIIAPHAGYIYSGATAASAYQLLKRPYHRIVLLGPSHYVGFNSVALDEAQGWRTPLGEVALDQKALSILSRSEYFKVLPEAFAREHSLEVQVPFLQKQLKSFKLVPLCCGQELASLPIALELNNIIDNDTLVAVSSDLSHYQPQQIAEKIDHKTIDAILSRDQERIKMDLDACGREGIVIINELAKLNNWQPQLVDYRTSAEASGDESAVVGYVGMVYY